MIQAIDDLDEWTRLGREFAHWPLYGSSPWARYKAGLGWRIRPLMHEQGQGRAAALVQTKRVGGIGPAISLIQGGPVVQGTCCLETVLTDLLRDGNCRLGIEAVMPAQASSLALEQALTRLGFRPLPSTGDGTFVLDLSADQLARRRDLSRDWTSNLKRAEKRNLDIRWIGTGLSERLAAADRAASLYRALTARKAFAPALDPVAFVAAVAGDDSLEWLEIWQGDVLMGCRMGWIGGEMALDLLAAQAPEARNTSASYMAMWTLIERCRQRGAAIYDCGGIDPQGNPGVYHFKQGLGGQEAKLGRLWMRARPGILTPAAVRFLAGRLL